MRSKRIGSQSQMLDTRGRILVVLGTTSIQLEVSKVRVEEGLVEITSDATS